MIDHDAVPSAAEFLARILPPAEYQDCVVVAVQGFFVWVKRSEVKPSDAVCFYDGDCRSVLTPDDPRVRNYFK
jgi:hypothetical protein